MDHAARLQARHRMRLTQSQTRLPCPTSQALDNTKQSAEMAQQRQRLHDQVKAKPQETLLCRIPLLQPLQSVPPSWDP